MGHPFARVGRERKGHGRLLACRAGEIGELDRHLVQRCGQCGTDRVVDDAHGAVIERGVGYVEAERGTGGRWCGIPRHQRREVHLAAALAAKVELRTLDRDRAQLRAAANEIEAVDRDGKRGQRAAAACPSARSPPAPLKAAVPASVSCGGSRP